MGRDWRRLPWAILVTHHNDDIIVLYVIHMAIVNHIFHAMVEHATAAPEVLMCM